MLYIYPIFESFVLFHVVCQQHTYDDDESVRFFSDRQHAAIVYKLVDSYQSAYRLIIRDYRQ